MHHLNAFGKYSIHISITARSISTCVTDSHGWVLQDFTQNTAVTATEYQDLFRAGMRVQRHVDHHLVIHELIRFGGLYNTVECHDATKPWILKDDEVLVVGGGFEQGLPLLKIWPHSV